jgi:hypothetical protein
MSAFGTLSYAQTNSLTLYYADGCTGCCYAVCSSLPPGQCCGSTTQLYSSVGLALNYGGSGVFYTTWAQAGQAGNPNAPCAVTISRGIGCQTASDTIQGGQYSQSQVLVSGAGEVTERATDSEGCIEPDLFEVNDGTTRFTLDYTNATVKGFIEQHVIANKTTMFAFARNNHIDKADI